MANELPAFEFFPVDLREYEGAPIVTSRGRVCPTRMDRVSYVDGWNHPRRGGYLHKSVDMFAPQGSWVIAPLRLVCDESTKHTGPTEKGGHCVMLRYPATGHRFYFAHMRDAPVFAVGDQVPAGARIGFVGRTGNAIPHSCPHLHLSCKDRAGRKVNIYSRLVACDPFKIARAGRTRAITKASTVTGSPTSKSRAASPDCLETPADQAADWAFFCSLGGFSGGQPGDDSDTHDQEDTE